MAQTVYLFINTEFGKEDEVLKALKKYDDVEEAYKLYGTYNIEVKIKAEKMSKLTDIKEEIRRIDGVRVILPLPVSGL